jgi:peptide deformylase
MVRDVLIWPDPRLKAKSLPVTKVTSQVAQIVDDLFETMYASEGVGLAAAQIGVAQRILVIDVASGDGAHQPLALINPVVLGGRGKVIWNEGCLSIPGEAEDVDRMEEVTVRALDREGKAIEIAAATGLLAVALQHEIDHLDGTLFVDRLSALKREVIRRRMKRLKAEMEEDRKSGRSRTAEHHTGGPAL